jgi:hypothetical protein
VDKPQTAEEEAKAWEVRSPASPSSPTPYGSEDSITLRGNLCEYIPLSPFIPQSTTGYILHTH